MTSDKSDHFKSVKQDPINLPSNPFWDVFKRFGKDESIALILNVGATAGLEYIFDSAILDSLAGPFARRLNNIKDLVLSTSGPVVEKLGFFPAHLNSAWKEYRSTPPEKRDSLGTYFKSAIKDGSKSLLEDVLIHDPLYVGLMAGGISIYPQVPAWMLSFLSFVTAVGVVSGLEVGFNELGFKYHKHSMKKVGFGVEEYFESRFLVDKNASVEKIIQKVSDEFNLSSVVDANYHDVYFENNLPHYSNRSPSIRLRNRTSLSDSSKEVKTAQIVYTRASEFGKRSLEQFRYFLSKKSKIYYLLDQDMPSTMDEINDPRVSRILKRFSSDKFYEINFNRFVSFDDELLVTADDVKNNNPFQVLELKVYHDKRLLKEAMKYVMMEFPILQITHNKLGLTSLSDGL